jgi:hypothetical protein
VPPIEFSETVYSETPATDTSADRLGSASLGRLHAPGSGEAFNLTLQREPHPVGTSAAKTRFWLPVAVVVGMIGIGAFVLFSFQGRAEPDGPGAGTGAASNAGGAATPEPAPVAGSVLRISSEPAGAGIVVDGVETGKVTPDQITIGKVVPSEVRLTRKGGLPPVSVPVTAAVLARGEISVTLPAAPAPVVLTSAVTITGTYAFEVVEGDRVVSPAAEMHEISVTGRRTLRLRADEVFLDRQLPVEATGRPLTFQAPEVGRLTIRTSFETCKLVLDRRDLGYPPVVNVPVVAGNHRLEQQCPDGTSRQAAFAIRPGESRTEYIK